MSSFSTPVNLNLNLPEIDLVKGCKVYDNFPTCHDIISLNLLNNGLPSG